MATILDNSAWIEIGGRGPEKEISFGGIWTVFHAGDVEDRLMEAVQLRGEPVVLDLEKVERMDTLGAWLIYRLSRDLRLKRVDTRFRGVSDEYKLLIERVGANDRPCEMAPPRRNSILTLLEDVGLGTLNSLVRLSELLGFLGLIITRLAGAFRQPQRIRVTSLVYHIEQVGLRALPIVGLISFLIGAVMVNQSAIQLRLYGAEVLVVDMLAISILRELGILLTAIIVAGRSGSAFTAQIGSMMLREEVDAMETIGLNPIDVLVLPRFLALLVVMPLLTFYADVAGILGGGLMAWAQLDMSPAVFLQFFQEAVPDIRTFWVGVIKAVFFAVVIGVSGCFEGLSVSGSAESVGQRTTQSVVQSIFLIIVLDALLAIFFTAVGW
ncbi:MAG: MlaE family lipid ABC transporter permease subunit [Proteobacteria bacterium]|nr:MlaE family lipid ABC transporter permease subunit [Pseudomonadota bacterium]